MLFEHRYAGSSAVRQGDAATAMSFAPDTYREPTYFRGRVTKQVEFREAISALHDVVISEMRFVPKDRTAYLEWRNRQSYIDLGAVMARQRELAAEIATLSTELAKLDAQSSSRWRTFYDARARYFKYLYERDKELWFKLDPVITVHPDQVFFECFSRDESSYGRLAASYEVFDELGDRACGTTNIDYSQSLYDEFQKIRSYKETTLDVDPSGFGVETSNEDRYREVKIDLPDTWVRGFLQVSSAMTLPATVVDLHPMDVHNLCFVLRRNKELFGPRSLRYQLEPGKPVKIVVEPWNFEVNCPRSIFRGDSAHEIRLWGRRRIHILERLLPRARRVRVFLLGSGLPSFYVVDLGDLSFTLGLSGWSHNNWSESSNFDLMAAREDVDSSTRERVFGELGKTWLATPDALSKSLGLAQPVVASALAGWVQCGRAIFDLDKGVYRKRELTREPLPMEKLRFSNPREEAAARMLHRAKIAVDRVESPGGGQRLVGRVQDNKLYSVEMTFDADRRMTDGECTCDYYVFNKLRKGPCEHMLALRSAHYRGVSDMIDLGDYRAIFRKAVTDAAQLQRRGRSGDALRELQQAARQMPHDTDELGRLHEVIAESLQAANEHDEALAHADKAMRRFPNSVVALRVRRDALVAKDDLASAITAARALCGAEDIVSNWEALLVLCRRATDWSAMQAFAAEASERHPKDKSLRDTIAHVRKQMPATGTGAAAAPDVAERSHIDAPRQSLWKRIVSRFSSKAGEPPREPTVDELLELFVDDLVGTAAVRDRASLIRELRDAHQATSGNERLYAMIVVLKASRHVAGLPADQDVLALLRRYFK
jgi:predicted nucleic acid-binding Zn finger protein